MWWELAQNTRVVLAYYTKPPLLLGVEIHSVRLHRDGPTLELLVELPRFPDRPSPRWPVGANAAQAGLRFFGLREVELSDWGTTNVGDLLIKSEGGVLHFRFESGTTRLSGVAEFFDVATISAYINGNPEAPSQ